MATGRIKFAQTQKRAATARTSANIATGYDGAGALTITEWKRQLAAAAAVPRAVGSVVPIGTQILKADRWYGSKTLRQLTAFCSGQNIGALHIVYSDGFFQNRISNVPAPGRGIVNQFVQAFNIYIYVQSLSQSVLSYEDFSAATNPNARIQFVGSRPLKNETVAIRATVSPTRTVNLDNYAWALSRQITDANKAGAPGNAKGSIWRIQTTMWRNVDRYIIDRNKKQLSRVQRLNALTAATPAVGITNPPTTPPTTTPRSPTPLSPSTLDSLINQASGSGATLFDSSQSAFSNFNPGAVLRDLFNNP